MLFRTNMNDARLKAIGASQGIIEFNLNGTIFGEVVNLVDAIASQTNLLALNATI